MASLKCHVCNSKSSSRWFSISTETDAEDLRRCFNVVSPCGEVCSCASCRRNLTRWRKSCHPLDCKYFAKANSRGKPNVNKATLARENRRLSLTNSRRMSSEPSYLLCMPEDLLLNTVSFLDIEDILNVRQTCKLLNGLCESNFLWKNLIRRDFPERIHLLDNTALSNAFLSYKIIYLVTQSAKREEFRERKQTRDIVEQFRENERKLLQQNEDIQQRLRSLQFKLTTLQTDQDPSTPVTKLQDQVISLYKIVYCYKITSNPPPSVSAKMLNMY